MAGIWVGQPRRIGHPEGWKGFDLFLLFVPPFYVFHASLDFTSMLVFLHESSGLVTSLESPMTPCIFFPFLLVPFHFCFLSCL